VGTHTRTAAVIALLIASAAVAPTATAAADPAARTEYTVLAADNVGAATAVAAIQRAGGRVVARTDDVGMFQVVGPASGFVERAAASPDLTGATHRRPIGHAPARKPTAAEKPTGPARLNAGPGPDPLDGRLWGLRMIRADKAHSVTAGDHRVAVGILDTGVDARRLVP
jgi:hypothetical protein